MKVLDLKKENKENLPEEKSTVPVFEWEGEKKSQKDVIWQIGAIVFLILVMGLFLYQKNYFGVMTVLIIIFLMFIAQQGNEKIQCAISKKGFRVKNELFLWENIKSFWIFEDSSELSLKIKKGIVQNVSVPIHEKDTERIKKFLLTFLPEEEVQKSLSEIIVKKIGL